jgi:hypothetical protein
LSSFPPQTGVGFGIRPDQILQECRIFLPKGKKIRSASVQYYGSALDPLRKPNHFGCPWWRLRLAYGSKL